MLFYGKVVVFCTSSTINLVGLSMICVMLDYVMWCSMFVVCVCVLFVSIWIVMLFVCMYVSRIFNVVKNVANGSM